MRAAFGPNEARFVLDVVALPALRLEQALTRRVIAAVPGQQMGYRPVEEARTAGDPARHIVGVELRFLEAAATGTFRDFGPELDPAAQPAEIAGFYETRFPGALQRLSETPGEQLLRVLDYKGLVQLPALGFVQYALNHTIHHRGEISVYLRAMGATVPPIYG